MEKKAVIGDVKVVAIRTKLTPSYDNARKAEKVNRKQNNGAWPIGR